MGRSRKIATSSHTRSFGTAARINHNASEFYSSKLYDEAKARKNTQCDETIFPAEYLNTIMQQSSEDMSILPDNCVHLMITSPPYNVTKDYDDDLTLNEYLEVLRKVFTETYRVLVSGGRACINVANLGRKPYIPLSAHIAELMLDIGFLMRGEIIWNKGAGAGVSMAWGSWQSATNPVLRDVHEFILVFSNGSF
jgi:site-specific DNA-methyltransferase (adenine-specific)